MIPEIRAFAVEFDYVKLVRGAILGTSKRGNRMGKILESLQNTIIAGIVLTVIMVVVAPMIAGEPDFGTTVKKLIGK